MSLTPTKNASLMIQGLAGKKSLRGEISIQGAKNAALKAMAAAVLFDGLVELQNVPDTADIWTMAEILKKIGAKVEWNAGNKTLTIDPIGINSSEINSNLAKNMRASVVLTGPLLSRFGKASFPAPGGCVIGARPIDLFLEGYKKMGATAILDEKECLYKIETATGLNAAEITFDKISVGATETLMMTAVLAKGPTILKNCAKEPEIANVAEWLNECGAKINGVGTDTITIEGTGGKLLTATKSYVTIPDRIEAGSFLILGALCAEELTIKDCQPEHLRAVVDLLKESGVPIEAQEKTLRIFNNTKPNSAFTAFNVRTGEYPSFPTDLQPPIAVYLTQVSGEISVVETIFEGRFKYVDDLIKMGAGISLVSSREIAITREPTALHELYNNEELRTHDIRAGFAIVLAALVATGTFTITNIQLIDRGYERLEEKLKAIGADIKRV